MGMSGIAFIGVFVILAVVAAIALIVFLVSRNQSSVPVSFPASRETPLQILDRRFAAGAITAEDYKKARDLLTGAGKT